jgi:hypothetical protein
VPWRARLSSPATSGVSVRRRGAGGEAIAAGTRGRSGDLGERLRRKTQRDAAIAAAVGVAAGVASAVIAEQQGAGKQRRFAVLAAIGKRSFERRGDSEAVVLFPERPVARSGVADEFADAPALAGGDRSLAHRSRCAVVGQDRHGPK